MVNRRDGANTKGYRAVLGIQACEHHEKRKRAKIRVKENEARKGTVYVFSIAWSDQSFKNLFR